MVRFTLRPLYLHCPILLHAVMINYLSIRTNLNLPLFTLRYLERWDGAMWTGLVWLRIGTGGELL
jgi:hypothetical protein